MPNLVICLTLLRFTIFRSRDPPTKNLNYITYSKYVQIDRNRSYLQFPHDYEQREFPIPFCLYSNVSGHYIQTQPQF